MEIEELKKIAEENDYWDFGIRGEYHTFVRERDGASIGISILELNKILFLDNDQCDKTDFNMIKAAMKFTETPISERGY